MTADFRDRVTCVASIRGYFEWFDAVSPGSRSTLSFKAESAEFAEALLLDLTPDERERVKMTWPGKETQ